MPEGSLWPGRACNAATSGKRRVSCIPDRRYGGICDVERKSMTQACRNFRGKIGFALRNRKFREYGPNNRLPSGFLDKTHFIDLRQ